MAFGKNNHATIVEMLAKGLHDMGLLKTYLELGIRRGVTFKRVASLCDVAVAVDIDQKAIESVCEVINGERYCMTTDTFFHKWASKHSYDLVFIDASHEHSQSYQDFVNVLPLVSDGGLIVMHDTYPPEEKYLSTHYCFDTWKTAEAIRGYKQVGYNLESVTLPIYCGLTVARKFSRHLVWKS
jgi:predicted O-methyltransferase YrrM